MKEKIGQMNGKWNGTAFSIFISPSESLIDFDFYKYFSIASCFAKKIKKNSYQSTLITKRNTAENDNRTEQIQQHVKLIMPIFFYHKQQYNYSLNMNIKAKNWNLLE